MFLIAISRITPTELEICLVVPVSINMSPLTGLESLKLVREGENDLSPCQIWDYPINITLSFSVFGRDPVDHTCSPTF
jgi:hypothetical protein